MSFYKSLMFLIGTIIGTIIGTVSADSIDVLAAQTKRQIHNKPATIISHDAKRDVLLDSSPVSRGSIIQNTIGKNEVGKNEESSFITIDMKPHSNNVPSFYHDNKELQRVAKGIVEKNPQNWKFHDIYDPLKKTDTGIKEIIGEEQSGQSNFLEKNKITEKLTEETLRENEGTEFFKLQFLHYKPGKGFGKKEESLFEKTKKVEEIQQSEEEEVPPPKRAYLSFGVHAREIISSELGLKFALSLQEELEKTKEGSPTNEGNEQQERKAQNLTKKEMKHLSNMKSLTLDYEILILLNANPTGRDLVFYGRGHNAACTRANAGGVDINRNFGQSIDQFTSPRWDPDSEEKSDVLQIFSDDHERSGPHAASEAETRIIMDVLRQFQPDIFIDTHTGEYSVLLPPADTIDFRKVYSNEPLIISNESEIIEYYDTKNSFLHQNLLPILSKINQDLHLQISFGAFCWITKNIVVGSQLDWYTYQMKLNKKPLYSLATEIYGRYPWDEDSLYYNVWNDRKWQSISYEGNIRRNLDISSKDNPNVIGNEDVLYSYGVGTNNEWSIWNNGQKTSQQEDDDGQIITSQSLLDEIPIDLRGGFQFLGGGPGRENEGKNSRFNDPSSGLCMKNMFSPIKKENYDITLNSFLNFLYSTLGEIAKTEYWGREASKKTKDEKTKDENVKENTNRTPIKENKIPRNLVPTEDNEESSMPSDYTNNGKPIRHIIGPNDGKKAKDDNKHSDKDDIGKDDLGKDEKDDIRLSNRLSRGTRKKPKKVDKISSQSLKKSLKNSENDSEKDSENLRESENESIKTSKSKEDVLSLFKMWVQVILALIGILFIVLFILPAVIPRIQEFIHTLKGSPNNEKKKKKWDNQKNKWSYVDKNNCNSNSSSRKCSKNSFSTKTKYHTDCMDPEENSELLQEVDLL